MYSAGVSPLKTEQDYIIITSPLHHYYVTQTVAKMNYITLSLHQSFAHGNSQPTVLYSPIWVQDYCPTPFQHPFSLPPSSPLTLPPSLSLSLLPPLSPLFHGLLNLLLPQLDHLWSLQTSWDGRQTTGSDKTGGEGRGGEDKDHAQMGYVSVNGRIHQLCWDDQKMGPPQSEGRVVFNERGFLNNVSL